MDHGQGVFNFDVVRDTQRQTWEVIQSKLGEKQQKVLNVIIERASTASEVADCLGWLIYRTSPRITELAQARLIEDSGERRLNPHSGKNTIVWQAVDPEKVRPLH